MKKNIINFLVLAVFLAGINSSFAKEVLNIGMVIDGQSLEFIRPMLEKELEDLLEHKTDVKIESSDIYNANWSKEKALEDYKSLEKSADIDFIITIGAISSEVVSSQEEFAKPTLSYGVKPKGSLIEAKNFAYISENFSQKENFEKLTQVYDFKKLAVSSLIKRTFDNEDKYIYIEPQDLLNKLEEDKDIDAVYLGYLGSFEGEYKNNLISELTKKRYPVFGFSNTDLKNGAYAIYASDVSLPVNIKNMAMIIDDYLDGIDLSGYKSQSVKAGYVALNLQTARKIGKMPGYDVLREVVVYNENLNSKVKPINIKQVILYALENNLNLSSAKIETKIAKKDVQLGKREFYPSVSLGPQFLFVDDEFSSLISERTGLFGVSLNQLIYSDKAVSNIVASKDLLKASEYSQAQKALGAIRDSSQAYLNVLKAQNRQNILKNQMEFSRENLELKEKAQDLGQISMSDVYRWKTEYTMSKNNFIQSKAATQNASLNLNRVLNKPIDTIFAPMDIGLNSPMFMSFENQKIKKIVDDPISSEIFADFLVEKAFKEQPIVLAIDKQIEANDTMAGFYKRRRFVPEIAATSSINSGMYEGGKGPSGGDMGTTYIAAVQANWNLFDGDKNRMNYKKSKLEVENLKTQKQNLKNDIEYTIRAKVAELVSKSANIDLSGKSADYANKNLELVQKSYNLGKVSIIELLNAKDAQLSAQMQYLDSVYDYLITVIDLQTQVGAFNILSEDSQKQDIYNEFEKYYNQKEQEIL